MIVVRRLERLERIAVTRLHGLRAQMDRVTFPVTPEDDRVIGYVAVETLNVWVQFSRYYLLSCALGCKDKQGVPIIARANRPANMAQAIDVAIRATRPLLASKPAGFNWRPLDEPTWREPSVILKLAGLFQLPQAQRIQAGLSNNSDVFARLHKVRNYFAHRCGHTYWEVVQHWPTPPTGVQLTVSNCVAARRRSRPQSVMSDWIDDIRTSILKMT
jgi:hypothetical protein